MTQWQHYYLTRSLSIFSFECFNDRHQNVANAVYNRMCRLISPLTYVDITHSIQALFYSQYTIHLFM